MNRISLYEEHPVKHQIETFQNGFAISLATKQSNLHYDGQRYELYNITSASTLILFFHCKAFHNLPAPLPPSDVILVDCLSQSLQFENKSEQERSFNVKTQNYAYFRSENKKLNHKKRTRDLCNTRRETRIQTELDQPPWENGQHQTAETRPQLQTSRKKRSWTPQETMAIRRCRNRSNDLIHVRKMMMTLTLLTQTQIKWEFLGFRSGVDQICYLLGYRGSSTRQFALDVLKSLPCLETLRPNNPLARRYAPK